MARAAHGERDGAQDLRWDVMFVCVYCFFSERQGC